MCCSNRAVCIVNNNYNLAAGAMRLSPGAAGKHADTGRYCYSTNPTALCPTQLSPTLQVHCGYLQELQASLAHSG
jgi:hypothetical protein